MVSTVLLTRSISRLRSLLVKPSFRIPARKLDQLTPECPAHFATRGRLAFGSGQSLQLFAESGGFLVMLSDLVDLPGNVFQPVHQHFFGDFFLIEGDDFFDRANAFFQVFAETENFTNHDGGTGDRLQDF